MHYCGYTSKTDLVNKIQNGDGKHSDIKSKFGSIGIYSNDILSANAYDGVVKKDGTVWIGGSKVASGVYSAGRSNMAGSTSWAGLYWRSPSVSFASDSIPAIVYGFNGVFKYAVIKSCGNPVLPRLAAVSPSITVEKKVSNTISDAVWRDENNAKPGDILKYSIKVKSTGPVTAEGVTVKDQLPSGVTLVSGSGEAFVGTSSYRVNDSAITGGVRIGNFVPNQDGYVTFKVKVNNTFPSGCTKITNVGYADSDYTGQISDKAYTNVCVTTVTTSTTTMPPRTTTTTVPPRTTTTTMPPETTTTTLPPTTTTTRPEYYLVVKKYEDKNKNGQKDLLEPMLSGWTFDIKGPDFSRMVVTGSDGTVKVSLRQAGSYTVTEHQKAGWGPTESDQLVKSVNVNETNEYVSFGNYKLPIVSLNYSVTINKYEDLNGDGLRQAHEGLLSGWRFTLKGEGVTKTEATDDSGSITFAGLKAGKYTITEDMQSGWKSITGISREVTLGPDQVVWFGNQKIVSPIVTPVTPILPVTGPFQAMAGFAGTISLGGGAWMYLRSRKSMINSLKNS